MKKIGLVLVSVALLVLTLYFSIMQLPKPVFAAKLNQYKVVKVGDSDTSLIQRILDENSQQGWELVTYSRYHLIFKK